jgi:hypothetical protein
MARAGHADQRSKGGLTGDNQRGDTPRTDMHAAAATRARIRERSPADPESTTEKQP